MPYRIMLENVENILNEKNLKQIFHVLSSYIHVDCGTLINTFDGGNERGKLILSA